jgi:nitroreductase
MRAAAWNQAQVTDASILVVICGDMLAHRRQPERYWATAPEPVRERSVRSIVHAYDGNPQLQRDEIMRSGGIAAQTMMLAAKGMGLDTCALAGFNFEKVGELIRLPEDYQICMMVAVGKPLKPAYARGGQLPLDEVMLRDHF